MILGGSGCLALIVNEAEMRRVANNSTLNCDRVTMPALLNPKTTDTTSAVDEKIFATEHQKTWYKYYLDQAVDCYGIAVIIASTASQYLT